MGDIFNRFLNFYILKVWCRLVRVKVFFFFAVQVKLQNLPNTFRYFVFHCDLLFWGLILCCHFMLPKDPQLMHIHTNLRYYFDTVIHTRNNNTLSVVSTGSSYLRLHLLIPQTLLYEFILCRRFCMNSFYSMCSQLLFSLPLSTHSFSTHSYFHVLESVKSFKYPPLFLLDQ